MVFGKARVAEAPIFPDRFTQNQPETRVIT